MFAIWKIKSYFQQTVTVWIIDLPHFAAPVPLHLAYIYCNRLSFVSQIAVKIQK